MVIRNEGQIQDVKDEVVVIKSKMDQVIFMLKSMGDAGSIAAK
jgi:hypothetical protein